MSKPFEICMIDDSFPTVDIDWINPAEALCPSCLRYLLLNANWTEEELKDLTDELISKPHDWHAKAFTNPELFFNNQDQTGYTPELIVYDWDYNVATELSSTHLNKIAASCHALIAVYSRSDHDGDIDDALQTEELKLYKSRIFKLHKEAPGSVQTLLTQFADHVQNNFSGQFSCDFRKSTRLATEQVLVSLGLYHIDDVFASFSSEKVVQEMIVDTATEKLGEQLVRQPKLLDYIKVEISPFKRCIDSLAGIARSKMQKLNVFANIPSTPATSSLPESSDAILRLWQFRLYYNPSDNLVRRGDIVEMSGNYYLVVSQSCDLTRFWLKTYGNILLVPLLRCVSDKQKIRDKVEIIKKLPKMSSSADHLLSSLTGEMPGWYDGVFSLPCVPVPEDNSDILIGYPKEITSYKIPVPEHFEHLSDDQKRNELSCARLKYEYWINANRICTLSEPFAGALIQKCISTLQGFGVPDYPSALQGNLKQGFKSVFS